MLLHRRSFALASILIVMLFAAPSAADEQIDPLTCNLAELWQWAFFCPSFDQQANAAENELQDLQVTIEVRFITLNNEFFDEIGIDFDFDLDQAQNFPQGPTFNNTGMNPDFELNLDPSTPAPLNPFTAPKFPFFGNNDGTAFGIAFLSDLEAFLFLQASQSDTRNNVLAAPKVTLFNGQVANVAHPQLGSFFFNQFTRTGTNLSVQAVLSEDRRYVRLSVFPTFNSLVDADVFHQNGEAVDEPGNQNGELLDPPEFQPVKKYGRVIVPDGQNVLLGSVKRLHVNPDPFGVPLLKQIPFINRLFRNVGQPRQSDSLMMMVTPRIIIQEEEEQ